MIGDFLLGKRQLALALGQVQFGIALAAQLGDLLAIGGIPDFAGIVFTS